jgi:tRNA/tmRNA/rRNA uracil-C5-methylase (TrmA/RlmC/RlmD family)
VRAVQPVAEVVGGELVELEIGGVAAGGACVARAPDGRVVFVRHCLPGERVRARMTSVGARFARADAVEVLTSSPQRVEPPCPHAGPGRCGGCDWQHAALVQQRAMKAELVSQALGRLARLDVAVEVEAVGPGDGLGWRTRARFGVARSGRVGLRRHRSNELELVESCPIASPAVESVGVERHRFRGASEVEVVAPAPGQALVVVLPRPGTRDDVLAETLPPLEARIAVGRAAAPRQAVEVEVSGHRFRLSGSAFWQVHVDAPEVLTAAVLDALRPLAGERVVDLHAGVGLFAVALAAAVGPSGSVVAVERDAVACADAAVNAAGLDRLEVRRAEVDGELVAGLEPFDLLVLDPPRSGAGTAVMAALGGRAVPPRRIAYVACDAPSLARDLRVLVDLGWSLVGLRAFDLFPMTEHVEVLAVLEPPDSVRAPATIS